MIALAPGVAAFAVGALVLVSARVRGFQEACQLGGLVVLPVIVVLLGQLSGVLYLDAAAVLVIAAIVWLAAAGMLALGYRAFRRDQLLVQG